MVDQATSLRDAVKKSKTPKKTKVISITSGKGGVGKTQVVANVALALQEKGLQVLIFDGDMGLANIDIVYNISPPYNLKHLLDGTKKIEEVIFKGPKGVSILPAASGIKELSEIKSSDKLTLVDQLDQLTGQYDFLLIDTAAGISENVMYLNSAAQQVIVVVTPEPTSITDAYALMKVASSQYQLHEFQIVTNQTKNESEGKIIFNSLLNATDQFLSSVKLTHIHNLSTDENVRRSVLSQTPIMMMDPRGATSESFRQLASKLVDLECNHERGGMQFFLKQAFGK